MVQIERISSPGMHALDGVVEQGLRRRAAQSFGFFVGI
jgi:hypothetical protein